MARSETRRGKDGARPWARNPAREGTSTAKGRARDCGPPVTRRPAEGQPPHGRRFGPRVKGNPWKQSEHPRPEAEPATAGRRSPGAPRRASRPWAAVRPASEKETHGKTEGTSTAKGRASDCGPPVTRRPAEGQPPHGRRFGP